MATGTAKTEKPKKRSGLLATMLVLLLLCLAGWKLLDTRDKLTAALEEKAAIEADVARQTQENRSMEAALERAEDPEYLQELARDQLGMVTPGQKDFYDVSN